MNKYFDDIKEKEDIIKIIQKQITDMLNKLSLEEIIKIQNNIKLILNFCKSLLKKSEIDYDYNKYKYSNKVDIRHNNKINNIKNPFNNLNVINNNNDYRNIDSNKNYPNNFNIN